MTSEQLDPEKESWQQTGKDPTESLKYWGRATTDCPNSMDESFPDHGTPAT